MGRAMGAKDHVGQIEAAENTIQYILAIVAPALMALMLYSFVLFNSLFTALLALTAMVAVLALIPAWKMHRLHFATWAKNTLPKKMITSAIGMIYISVAAVFAVSMLSIYEGFNPEKPATFAIAGGMLIGLLGIMTYSDRNKARFESSEKRFFESAPETMVARLTDELSKNGHDHKKVEVKNGMHVELPSGLKVRILRLGKANSEVLVENIQETNKDSLALVKRFLEPA
ncbi:MAG TPA: hypothetical protein VMB46_03855 [Methanomassiliicoccales archaeon]|nr:hypothetical protein [Methanomassiliicoccales archaeon]